jgi:hypothetical protein
MRNAPGAGRRQWRPHRRKDRLPAHPTPQACTPSGQTMADAMQQAISLLTATLDSPGLQAWAVAALIPDDPDTGTALYVMTAHRGGRPSLCGPGLRAPWRCGR